MTNIRNAMGREDENKITTTANSWEPLWMVSNILEATKIWHVIELASVSQVCSYLCLHSQLVGDLQLSQLQRQFKPVLWVCGHSQRLLLEALKKTKKQTSASYKQKLYLSGQYTKIYFLLFRIRDAPIDRPPIVIGRYSLSADRSVLSIKADQESRSHDVKYMTLFSVRGKTSSQKWLHRSGSILRCQKNKIK